MNAFAQNVQQLVNTTIMWHNVQKKPQNYSVVTKRSSVYICG